MTTNIGQITTRSGELEPITHEVIDRIAECFCQLPTRLYRSNELVQIIQSSEENHSVKIGAMYEMIESYKHTNTITNHHNISFWYALKPKTLRSIAAFMKKTVQELSNNENTCGQATTFPRIRAEEKENSNVEGRLRIRAWRSTQADGRRRINAAGNENVLSNLTNQKRPQRNGLGLTRSIKIINNLLKFQHLLIR